MDTPGQSPVHSPSGSGLISVSISSTPSSSSVFGADIAPRFTVSRGPLFRFQPASTVAFGSKSGAGATLTRPFRCFPKESSFLLQPPAFGAESLDGNEDFSEGAVPLEARVLLADKSILTNFLKDYFTQSVSITTVGVLDSVKLSSYHLVAHHSKHISWQWSSQAQIPI